jgi:hypothetical protein
MLCFFSEPNENGDGALFYYPMLTYSTVELKPTCLERLNFLKVKDTRSPRKGT